MTIFDLDKPLVKHDRTPANLVEKPRRQNHIKYRVTDRHCQWVGPEGRAMGAGGHPLPGFRAGEACTKRKSAANCFGDSHNVGCDPTPLVGEEAAGPPDARLDFVEYQQKSMLIT